MHNGIHIKLVFSEIFMKLSENMHAIYSASHLQNAKQIPPLENL